MNGLDLFSGIGGLAIALEPYVRPIAYCENDRYAQAVLLSRQLNGRLRRAPIWDDVRTLTSHVLPSGIDIIYGGFPCQDISSAGRGVGMEAGSRSGLFSEILRLTEEIRPSFVFLENVPAIRTRGLARILCEFTALRYDCRWTVVSAAEIGAPHLRKRWFMLAADSDRFGIRNKLGRRIRSQGKDETKSFDNGEKELVANPESQRCAEAGGFRCEQSEKWPPGRSEALADSSSIGGDPGAWRGEESQRESEDPFSENWWAIEPNVGRVANGIPLRVDRLRGLGNAVVPKQAREAFKRLSGLI